MPKTSKNINRSQDELIETLDEIQNMCCYVLLLYDAYAKRNQELNDLANLTYYLLWNYSKSIIALKLFLNSALRSEQDFALGQICITINECTKKVIGYKTKDGKDRNGSIWINDMGRFISKHPELEDQYIKLKNGWILYADGFDNNEELRYIRNIATHGDRLIDNMMYLKELSATKVIHYLNAWDKNMRLTSDFVFMCFENECQCEINHNH